jgi:fumarate reductase flavoprotein subunit
MNLLNDTTCEEKRHMIRELKHRSENLEADIVVLGAGGAGLAAAVAAAGKGAKVIVLEKRPIPGGATLFAGGTFAIESPVQKRLGVTETKEDVFKIIMHHSHWTLNPRIVRAWIDQSGDTIEWFEKKGLNFRLIRLYPDQTPLALHCSEKNGSAIINTLMQECQELAVPVLFKTRANAILTDKSGSPTRVIARDEKKEIVIQTKSVFIATGGYGGSKSLLKKYCPEYICREYSLRALKNIHNGDGIRMAFNIGAASEGLGQMLLHGPALEADRFAWFPFIEACTLWINRDGERFMAEAADFNPFESPNGVLRQPGQMCFSIFDEDIKQYLVTHGLERSQSGTHLDPIKFKESLGAAAAKGEAGIFGSLGELAKWMKIAPQILRDSIDEYNVDCDERHDHLFFKNTKYLRPLRKPPYYVAKCYPGHLSTLGGIKINQHMEVLNKDFRPIPGLYAGGNDAGGFAGTTYNGQTAGTGSGFALASGRIAGENAANYVFSRSKKR